MTKPLNCPELGCNGEILIMAQEKDRSGITTYLAHCTKCRKEVSDLVGDGTKAKATRLWNSYVRKSG